MNLIMKTKEVPIHTNCGYTLFWQHMITSNASLMDFSAVYVALPPCKMQKRCSYVNFDTEWRVWLPNLDLTFNNWGHSRPREYRHTKWAMSTDWIRFTILPAFLVSGNSLLFCIYFLLHKYRKINFEWSSCRWQ